MEQLHIVVKKSFDELMKILEEEQEKFTELSEKHGEQLEKLEANRLLKEI